MLKHTEEIGAKIDERSWRRRKRKMMATARESKRGEKNRGNSGNILWTMYRSETREEQPKINPSVGQARSRRKLFTAHGSKQLNDEIYSFASTPTLRAFGSAACWFCHWLWTTKGHGLVVYDVNEDSRARASKRWIEDSIYTYPRVELCTVSRQKSRFFVEGHDSGGREGQEGRDAEFQAPPPLPVKNS